MPRKPLPVAVLGTQDAFGEFCRRVMLALQLITVFQPAVPLLQKSGPTLANPARKWAETPVEPSHQPLSMTHVPLL